MPWLDDQTLFVKNLRFACQAKFLTVWPFRAIYFLLRQAKHVFELFQKHPATNFVNFARQAMLLDVANRSTICCQENLECWTNNV